MIFLSTTFQPYYQLSDHIANFKVKYTRRTRMSEYQPVFEVKISPLFPYETLRKFKTVLFKLFYGTVRFRKIPIDNIFV